MVWDGAWEKKEHIATLGNEQLQRWPHFKGLIWVYQRMEARITEIISCFGCCKQHESQTREAVWEVGSAHRALDLQWLNPIFWLLDCSPHLAHIQSNASLSRFQPPSQVWDSEAKTAKTMTHTHIYILPQFKCVSLSIHPSIHQFMYPPNPSSALCFFMSWRGTQIEFIFSSRGSRASKPDRSQLFLCSG